jgi:hypothetical protein
LLLSSHAIALTNSANNGRGFLGLTDCKYLWVFLGKGRSESCSAPDRHSETVATSFAQAERKLINVLGANMFEKAILNTTCLTTKKPAKHIDCHHTLLGLCAVACHLCPEERVIVALQLLAGDRVGGVSVNRRSFHGCGVQRESNDAESLSCHSQAPLQFKALRSTNSPGQVERRLRERTERPTVATCFRSASRADTCDAFATRGISSHTVVEL